jgi:hypothetical protein
MGNTLKCQIHFIVFVALKCSQRSPSSHRLIQRKYNRPSYRNCPRDPYPLVQVIIRSEGVAIYTSGMCSGDPYPRAALGTITPRVIRAGLIYTPQDEI